MSSVLVHFASAALLFAGFAATGYALERALFRHAALGELRNLGRIALGLVAWMAASFALAALGELSRGPVLGFALLGAAAAAWARRRFGPARDVDSRADLVFLGAALVACLPIWCGALGPEISWDASAYHLTLPKQWLAAGGFTPTPLNVYSHWPLGVELLFAVALMWGDPAVAKLVHTGLGLLALLAVYAGARHAERPVAGWIAAPLVIANGVVVFELGIAYVDLGYAFFFAAGVLLLHQATRSSSLDTALLALAGICAGALASLKVTGVLGALALASVALPRIVAALRGGERQTLVRFAGAFGLPVVLLALPWPIRAALETGNPVYPFLYDVFGGPDWSAALATQFTAWQRSIGMGREPLDYALLPFRVFATGGGGYDRFAGDLGDFWVAVVPLTALAGWRVPLVRSCLGAASVYFVLWALGSQQARFLIPLLPLLALAAGIAAIEASRRLPETVRSAALTAAGLGALGLAVAEAREDAARNLSRSTNPTPSVLPVHRFVANELPSDARLLLLNTNQGFQLERGYLADSFFEASQIADWLGGTETKQELREQLADRGISHVLRERRSWGIAWPAALDALLRDPSLANPRYQSPDGRFQLWELR